MSGCWNILDGSIVFGGKFDKLVSRTGAILVYVSNGIPNYEHYKPDGKAERQQAVVRGNNQLMRENMDGL